MAEDARRPRSGQAVSCPLRALIAVGHLRVGVERSVGEMHRVELREPEVAEALVHLGKEFVVVEVHRTVIGAIEQRGVGHLVAATASDLATVRGERGASCHRGPRTRAHLRAHRAPEVIQVFVDHREDVLIRCIAVVAVVLRVIEPDLHQTIGNVSIVVAGTRLRPVLEAFLERVDSIERAAVGRFVIGGRAAGVAEFEVSGERLVHIGVAGAEIRRPPGPSVGDPCARVAVRLLFERHRSSRHRYPRLDHMAPFVGEHHRNRQVSVVVQQVRHQRGVVPADLVRRTAVERVPADLLGRNRARRQILTVGPGVEPTGDGVIRLIEQLGHLLGPVLLEIGDRCGSDAVDFPTVGPDEFDPVGVGIVAQRFARFGLRHVGAHPHDAPGGGAFAITECDGQHGDAGDQRQRDERGNELLGLRRLPRWRHGERRLSAPGRDGPGGSESGRPVRLLAVRLLAVPGGGMRGWRLPWRPRTARRRSSWCRGGVSGGCGWRKIRWRRDRWRRGRRWIRRGSGRRWRRPGGRGTMRSAVLRGSPRRFVRVLRHRLRVAGEAPWRISVP